MLNRILFLSWMTLSPSLCFAHAHEGDLQNVPKAFAAEPFETQDSAYSVAGKIHREAAVPQALAHRERVVPAHSM